jgi:hypothetical protein
VCIPPNEVVWQHNTSQTRIFTIKYSVECHRALQAAIVVMLFKSQLLTCRKCYGHEVKKLLTLILLEVLQQGPFRELLHERKHAC